MAEYAINRETYKRIKKMDRLELDEFLKRFAEENHEKIPTTSQIDLAELEDIYHNAINYALENVKGIGPNRREEFLKAINEKLKESKNAE